MKLWITKPWTPWQIMGLKWCCLLFGVALGAYFGDALRPHLVLILGAALLLTIWPAMHYFSDKG